MTDCRLTIGNSSASRYYQVPGSLALAPPRDARRAVSHSVCYFGFFATPPTRRETYCYGLRYTVSHVRLSLYRLHVHLHEHVGGSLGH
jgi:hypothetical protein